MANEENIGISFVNIPIEIFSSKEITANEKILYGYLSIFKKQCCFQSNETIAEKLGMSTATVTRGLKRLEELGYVFIEFINKNSARRRVYVVFDNPKKLKYLMSKGFLGSFKQGFEHPNHFEEGANQNDEGANHFDLPNNGGEANHFEEHKIIKENKNIDEASALAFELPSRASNNKVLKRSEILEREYAV